MDNCGNDTSTLLLPSLNDSSNGTPIRIGFEFCEFSYQQNPLEELFNPSSFER